jgi:Protein of unknown function with PCYCGC motif
MLKRSINITISFLLFSAGMLISACNHENTAHNHQQPQSAASTNTPAPAATAGHSHAPIPATKDRVPAYFKKRPDPKDLPPILSPALFTGQTRYVYQLAKEMPETLAQLPCFCYCDYSVGHKSLHSCFEDEHGVGCPLCQESVLMAKELKDDGLNIDQIRDKLIAKYSKH